MYTRADIQTDTDENLSVYQDGNSTFMTNNVAVK